MIPSTGSGHRLFSFSPVRKTALTQRFDGSPPPREWPTFPAYSGSTSAAGYGASGSSFAAQPPVAQPRPPLRSAVREPTMFRERTQRLNWTAVSAVSVEEVARRFDVDTLERFVSTLTFSDLTLEARLADPEFLKAFRLAQLLIEYLLYVQSAFQANEASLKDALAASEAQRTQGLREVEELRDLLEASRTARIEEQRRECPVCIESRLTMESLLEERKSLHHELGQLRQSDAHQAERLRKARENEEMYKRWVSILEQSRDDVRAQARAQELDLFQVMTSRLRGDTTGGESTLHGVLAGNAEPVSALGAHQDQPRTVHSSKQAPILNPNPPTFRRAEAELDLGRGRAGTLAVDQASSSEEEGWSKALKSKIAEMSSSSKVPESSSVGSTAKTATTPDTPVSVLKARTESMQRFGSLNTDEHGRPTRPQSSQKRGALADVWGASVHFSDDEKEEQDVVEEKKPAGVRMIVSNPAPPRLSSTGRSSTSRGGGSDITDPTFWTPSEDGFTAITESSSEDDIESLFLLGQRKDSSSEAYSTSSDEIPAGEDAFGGLIDQLSESHDLLDGETRGRTSDNTFLRPNSAESPNMGGGRLSHPSPRGRRHFRPAAPRGRGGF